MTVTFHTLNLTLVKGETHMTTITDVILDTTMPLDTPIAGIDADPNTGSGSNLDEMDAPEGFTSDFFTFDPYVGS